MESNWVKARSVIVWLLALAVAFGSVWWIERETGRAIADRRAGPAAAQPLLPPSADLPAIPAPRPLTAQEKAWARVAWTYFEKNTDPGTGLAGAVEGFGGATLWDMASTLMALLAARELELVGPAEFDQRLGRALDSLARLPLYAGELPNKSYDVRTLSMTDYANQPSAGGIGWSAIDIARMVVPLQVVAWKHPAHTPKARAVLARWRLDRVAQGGQLWGMEAGSADQAPQRVQEGRLGYEQYAARALALVGADADRAASWETHARMIELEGVRLPADTRDAKRFGAQDFLVSEPFMLAGLELGASGSAREAAWRIYRAQEARHRKTGQLTAVTEDHIDRPPHFLYNTLHAGGRNWVAITDKGQDFSALRSLSTKAAFGLHALYRTPYTTQLVEAVAPLHDPARGWYAGRYEASGEPNRAVAANTNAVVLESLAYIARGPLLAP